MTVRLVASLDIDGTQYAYAERDGGPGARELQSCLNAMRESGQLFLIHNTGRPYPWVCHGDPVDLYLNPVIATPDIIISHAGTVMWRPPFTEPCPQWRAHVASLVKPETVTDLKETLLKAGFALHPETADNEFKVCALVDETHSVADLRALVSARYGDAFEVFYWNSSSADITPKGANKENALRHVLRTEGLETAPVIVAGDSMNDFPVLEKDGFRRIVVGNATNELRQKLSGKQGVFIAHASQPAAQGVLAGLKHYGFGAPAP